MYRLCTTKNKQYITGPNPNSVRMSRKRSISPIEADRIINLYVDNIKPAAIARKLRRDARTVRKFIRDNPEMVLMAKSVKQSLIANVKFPLFRINEFGTEGEGIANHPLFGEDEVNRLISRSYLSQGTFSRKNEKPGNKSGGVDGTPNKEVRFYLPDMKKTTADETFEIVSMAILAKGVNEGNQARVLAYLFKEWESSVEEIKNMLLLLAMMVSKSQSQSTPHQKNYHSSGDKKFTDFLALKEIFDSPIEDSLKNIKALIEGQKTLSEDLKSRITHTESQTELSNRLLSNIREGQVGIMEALAALSKAFGKAFSRS